MSVPITNEPTVSDLPADHWLFKVKSVMLKTIIISITVIGIIAGALAMFGSNGSIILQLFQTVSIITIASAMIIVDAGLIAKKKSPFLILFGLITSVIWLAIGVYKIWVQPLIEAATRTEVYPPDFATMFYTQAEFIVNFFTLAMLFGIFRLYVFIFQLVINLIKESKISFVKNIAKTVTIPLMTLATILVILPLTITLSVVPFGDAYWRITTGGIILAFVGFLVVFLSSKFFDEKKPKPVKTQPQQEYYYPQQAQQYPQQGYNNYPQYGYPQQPEHPFAPVYQEQPLQYPQQPVEQPPAPQYDGHVPAQPPPPPAPEQRAQGSIPPPPPAPPVPPAPPIN